MYGVGVTIFLLFISTYAEVTWLPDTSFNLPINFKDGKLPCSKQTVVFPETLSGSVRIESETSVAGMILPVDGEFFLAEGEFEFGPTDDNCTDEGNVYYMEKSTALWSQPDVWSSRKFNKATPDAERVPCYDDIVEFPPSKVFTVVLPDSTQKVRGIEIGGESYDTTDFKNYVMRLSNQAQQFVLNQYLDTGIVVEEHDCKSRAGCPCQSNVLKIDCSAKYCERPTCVDAIQPVGHCCYICGGALAFDIDQSFDMMSFQEFVEKIVDSYGKDRLEYHIGRIPPNKVQVIVVDKDKYDQTSAEVVNTIAYNMEEHLVKQLQISGSPLSKKGLGGKIFISVFFVVTFLMFVIYVYYYKLPQFNYPIIVGRSHPGLFSRFNRRTESVVSLTRRDSVPPIGSTATAFRNPLYDSKRGRVSIGEPIHED